MIPIIVSQSESEGGAARAAARLHHALVSSGIPSRMRVSRKYSDDWRVEGPNNYFGKLMSRIRPDIGNILLRLQHSDNPVHHSLQCLPSRHSSLLNKSDADVINLHWVCNEMMSISDIGRIKKPLVWTLHDSWPFCGAEHHPYGPADQRWLEGYTARNRGDDHQWLDLDAWVWRRKVRSWRRPIHLVSPSEWLADNARKSLLARHWPIDVIPNAVPIDVYKPLPRDLARDVVGIDRASRVVLFGAIGIGAAKGWDLLLPALRHVAQSDKDVICIVLGMTEPRQPPSMPLRMRYVPRLADDIAMTMMFNAADVVIVPSRVENFPQMATEAQACGIPVVGFATTGLCEAIEDGKTGLLARSFDPDCLGQRILDVLSNKARSEEMGKRARNRARKLWSYDVVASAYADVYEQAILAHRTSTVRE
jgi:glycosyltransferase involved in cell wall biosynthesis